MLTRRVKKSFSLKEATTLVLLGTLLDSSEKMSGDLEGVVEKRKSLDGIDEKLSGDLKGVVERLLSLGGVDSKNFRCPVRPKNDI